MDGVLYAKVRDGGLALTRLSTFIPISIVRKYGTLHKSDDEILHASFRFEGESVAEKMHKWSKLRVMEKIWNPNINRQLDEADTIIEDSEDGWRSLRVPTMQTGDLSSGCGFAGQGYFNCQRATLKSRKGHDPSHMGSASNSVDVVGNSTGGQYETCIPQCEIKVY
ncbi:hypothetical protein chiPu_0000003 [Chiloscyllium punctatum]|uniref:Uncharacterized protein n=1 Tax=Chiloscyllium punctatum TaxID=137246 RepID=A0A401RMS5_CHIPU|nr:hypothetical protein [Chiloscyllium punctatum]